MFIPPMSCSMGVTTRLEKANSINGRVPWGLIASLAHFSLTYLGILFDNANLAEPHGPAENLPLWGQLADLSANALMMPLGLFWPISLEFNLSDLTSWLLIALNSAVCGFTATLLIASLVVSRRRSRAGAASDA